MDRREFLTGTMGAALLAARPADAFAQRSAPPRASGWDAGQVRHLLPTVSGTAMLVKASFTAPLAQAPRLRIGSTSAHAQMTDTAGECWQFFAAGLQPGRTYELSLAAANRRALCERWELSTFPAADARPERLRALFFTCAGGPESASLTAGNLPTVVRNRLLRRALSFAPQVAIANGDHVYWDLHPVRGAASGNTTRLDSFNRSALVFGSTNETVLKAAVAPQIVPVYGTDFRSTPVFFLQDDHDHFDNDEGTDTIVTFPPPWFQIQLARATQRMYYPEFLPDATRPANLPWSSSSDRVPAVSESFGTLRFGRLAEVNLYDVRRTMTLAGPSAVFVDLEVERWLLARAAADDVTHLVHAPSNPPGWSAGKWGEWYPDLLAADGKLSTAKPKPYWQSGWLAQHDRLVKSLTAMKNRIPLAISGDLHAVALGSMVRAGTLNMQANPVTAVLAGPIGTAPFGWPSAVRGVGATPPGHLDMREIVKPIEQHGFTIADFLPDRIVLRLFKWDVKTQSPEAIDTLEPFHVETLERR
jgi:hypothetical protein